MCDKTEKQKGYNDCYNGLDPEKHASEFYMLGYSQAYHEIEANSNLMEQMEDE